MKKKFQYVFTISHHLSSFQPRNVQSTPSHPISSRPILILCFPLYVPKFCHHFPRCDKLFWCALPQYGSTHITEVFPANTVNITLQSSGYCGPVPVLLSVTSIIIYLIHTSTLVLTSTPNVIQCNA